ncbi:YczE/YyaS/YitT family protein [Pseudoflavonifractor phocaeensis]|uniref:YczE/YyaS/YitT family protein n=1 Tax=Pseudoflavonifractor phocaeensis TaxID=1870988 RepID=UPI00210F0721|nr:hypothetical protein [Pseudoflavonifractor phocaeensis]MCQ4866303.1 hypothetical protein [Pseudoflavonifractor phocaeensis]
MKREQLYRLGFYLGGIVTLAVGNVLSTKALLGVSPIISPAYAISSIWKIDFGLATFGVYLVFLAVELLLLGRRRTWTVLLQIPFSLVFSLLLNVFIAGYDALAAPLGLDAPSLWQKILLLTGSVVLTGVGAAMIVNMQLVPSPPDGMAKAAGEALRRGLGFGKNVVDLCCVVASTALGLIAARTVVGIGPGTLVAMVAIGRCIALFNHFCRERMQRAAGLLSAEAAMQE